MSGLRYAVWAVPGAAQAAPWQARIDAWAAAYHGQRFSPHITVTSGLFGAERAVVARVRGLVSGLARFSVHLAGAACGGERFTACFLDLAPAPALLRARRRLRAAWGLAELPFRPHLSVFYGFPAPEQREVMLATLALLHPARLRIAALDLWRIEDDPNRWRRVERWALRPGGFQQSSSA